MSPKHSTFALQGHARDKSSLEKAGRTPTKDSIMTESLKGAATTAGRQISAELTERRSQPSGAGARRAARLWRTSGAFEGGIAKSPKKARALKLRKVAELQAEAVPGPGFLDKEPAEDIIIEEDSDEDIESVPCTQAGCGLPKDTAKKELSRQHIRCKRNRQQSSSDEDSDAEGAEDTAHEEDIGNPQNEEDVPGRPQGSRQPKTAAEKEHSRQQARLTRHRQGPCGDADSSVEAAEDTLGEEQMDDPQDEKYVPDRIGIGQPKTPAKKERPMQQARPKRHRQNPRSNSVVAAEDTLGEEDIGNPQDDEYVPGRAEDSGQPKTQAKKERPAHQARPKRQELQSSDDEDSTKEPAEDTLGEEDIGKPQDEEHVPGRTHGSGQPKTPANKDRHRQQALSKRQKRLSLSSEESSVEATEDTIREEEMGGPQDKEYVPGRTEGSGQPKTPAEKERPGQHAGVKRRRQELPGSKLPAKDTASEEDVISPQDEEHVPGRAQGSGQPRKVAVKECPRIQPRQEPPSAEGIRVSETDVGGRKDPEYVLSWAEGRWLPNTPPRKEAPQKRPRLPPSDEDSDDEDHFERPCKRARSSPPARAAYIVTTGQASARPSLRTWQADADAAAVCRPAAVRDKLGAPAAGSAYYAPQTYYSGSACAAAAASEPSFLLPAAMLSPMYQTGSAPGFHPLYQKFPECDPLGPYTPHFGHTLGTSTPYSPLSTAVSSQLPPVPDTAGGAVFDALLESDSDLSRSSSLDLLSDALGAAPPACAPETPQSACRHPSAGGPCSAASQHGVQSLFALHNAALFQSVGHWQLPGRQLQVAV